MNEPNERLIDAKEKLARQRAGQGKGTGRDEAARDRLPPGQHLVANDWPVLDLGIQPAVSRDEWSLQVDGAVENARVFSWADFAAFPQTKLVTDFHCVTTWSIYDAEIEGVLWRDFLEAAKPSSNATHVMFHSYDGYSTNLPMSELDREDVMLIHSFGGKPLTREHGGPVRGWVPQLYAWKSAKWVKRVEFMTQDKHGFWEVRGYHNHGDPWKEERYS